MHKLGSNGHFCRGIPNLKDIKYFDPLFCHNYTKPNICAKFERNRCFELYHLPPGSPWFSRGHVLNLSAKSFFQLSDALEKLGIPPFFPYLTQDTRSEISLVVSKLSCMRFAWPLYLCPAREQIISSGFFYPYVVLSLFEVLYLPFLLQWCVALRISRWRGRQDEILWTQVLLWTTI